MIPELVENLGLAGVHQSPFTFCRTLVGRIHRKSRLSLDLFCKGTLDQQRMVYMGMLHLLKMETRYPLQLDRSKWQRH